MKIKRKLEDGNAYIFIEPENQNECNFLANFFHSNNGPLVQWSKKPHEEFPELILGKEIS